MLPPFFAYAFGDRVTVIARTGVFYLGLVATLVPLGVAGSMVGVFFNLHRDALVLVLSIMVIAFGVLQALGVSFALLRRCSTNSSASGGTGIVQIFALGTGYGVDLRTGDGVRSSRCLLRADSWLRARSSQSWRTPCHTSSTAIISGVVLIALGGFLAAGCPVFQPLRPLLAVASLALLGWALWSRLTSTAKCAR